MHENISRAYPSLILKRIRTRAFYSFQGQFLAGAQKGIEQDRTRNPGNR